MKWWALAACRALVAASRYLRTLLPRRKSLRLVMLWSHPPGGREDTERIVSYFEDFAPRVVEVGGAPTEARAFFREEAVRLATQTAAAAGGARFAPSAEVDAEAEVALPLIAGVVAHLCATTVDGGILIFLPTAELVATLALKLAAAAPYSHPSRICIRFCFSCNRIGTVWASWYWRAVSRRPPLLRPRVHCGDPLGMIFFHPALQRDTFAFGVRSNLSLHRWHTLPFCAVLPHLYSGSSR